MSIILSLLIYSFSLFAADDSWVVFEGPNGKRDVLGDYQISVEGNMLKIKAGKGRNVRHCDFDLTQVSNVKYNHFQKNLAEANSELMVFDTRYRDLSLTADQKQLRQELVDKVEKQKSNVNEMLDRIKAGLKTVTGNRMPNTKFICKVDANGKPLQISSDISYKYPSGRDLSVCRSAGFCSERSPRGDVELTRLIIEDQKISRDAFNRARLEQQSRPESSQGILPASRRSETLYFRGGGSGSK